MFNDERFIKLVAPHYQQLLTDYGSYLQMGWKSFSATRIAAEIQYQKLELLEKALYRECPLPQSVVGRLQKAFVAENLSLYLLSDALNSWRYLASGKLPVTEAQASDVIGYAASALARMLMVLNDEGPSTYLPMSSLVMFFIFLQMFVTKDVFVTRIKLSKRQKESRLSGLLKSSRVLLSIVKSKRLKFRLALLLNTAAVLLEKFKNNKQQTIGILDYARIILYSTIQFLVIRKRTVTKEGM